MLLVRIICEDYRHKNSAVQPVWDVEFDSPTLTIYNAIDLGGPLVSEVGYHPRKKIHVIRVVFQDKAMYARTSFRGAKTCKIGKKGMFLVILTNFGIDMTLKLRKTLAKTRI